MNRTGLVLSGIIATIGTAKILSPQLINTFFTLDALVAVIAVLTAVIAYGVWFGPLKFLSGSYLLGTLGLSSMILAFGMIASPTLLGIRESFVPLADIFILFESGIVLTMIGLERKRRAALSPLLVISLIWQLLQRRLQRQSSAVPVTQ